MFRILFLVVVLFNSLTPSLGEPSNDCPVETCCPEALKRFTDAVLRTTTNALKNYADSTCETGAIAALSSMFLLATLAIYAEGETKNEISRVLDLRNNEEILCVISNINDVDINITGCAEFSAAPCFFANDFYPLTPAFKNTVEVITLNGLAKNFDFSQSKKSGNAINQILAQRTKNQVQNAVTDYSIFNSSTQLVAISALYFMGGWEIQFQRTNEVTQFRISPTESEPQTFLYQDAVYNYAYSELLGAKVAEVNMCLEQLSIWFLLPDCPFTEGAVIDKMAENLDWFYELKKIMVPTRLDIYIPTYNKTTTVNPSTFFQGPNGTETPYNGKTSELKGVIEGDIQVAITAGVQTVKIMSSFEGNYVPEVVPKGPKKTMKADYPFIFMIFRYGRPYFAGTVRRAIT